MVLLTSVSEALLRIPKEEIISLKSQIFQFAMRWLHKFSKKKKLLFKCLKECPGHSLTFPKKDISTLTHDK